MPIHERIALAWQRPRASDLIRRVLVLLADHELNASTFAARVAASTGAPLSAATLAGLSTLIGPRHGRAAATSAAIVVQAREIGAEAAIKDKLRQGAQFHFFGHPLYRETGDARASALLEHLELPTPTAIWNEALRIFSARNPMSTSRSQPQQKSMICLWMRRCFCLL